MRYYALKDMQNFGDLMHTGRNTKNLEELRQDMLGYLEDDHTVLEMKRLSKCDVQELADYCQFDIVHQNKKYSEAFNYV